MVFAVRFRSGILLARESYIKADIVSSIPDSGTSAAHGFSIEVSTCKTLHMECWNFCLDDLILYFSRIFHFLKYYVKIGI